MLIGSSFKILYYGRAKSVADDKGWSKKERDPLTGDYVEHHDEDGKVTGWSKKERGPFRGDYVEHHAQDGSTTGWSKKERGPFRGDYVEHHDKDGKVTGWSKNEYDPITGDYVEYHDTTGKVTGWSKQEKGLFGDYTQHHGSTYHHTNDDEQESYQSRESRNSRSSSTGGSSDGAGAVGAVVLLVPLLAVAGVLWLLYTLFKFIFKICGGYKITPMVSAQERLRVRLARAKAEYEATQARLSIRRPKLAFMVITLVALPLGFVSLYLVTESLKAIFPEQWERTTLLTSQGENRITKLKKNVATGERLTINLKLLEEATGVSWKGYVDLYNYPTLKQIGESLPKPDAGWRWSYNDTVEPISATEAKISYRLLNGRTRYKGQVAVKIKFTDSVWRIEEVTWVQKNMPELILLYAHDFTTDKSLAVTQHLISLEENTIEHYNTYKGGGVNPLFVKDAFGWNGVYKSSEGKLCFTIKDFKFKTLNNLAPQFLRGHEIGVGYEVKMLNGSLRSSYQQHTVKLKDIGDVAVDTILLMKMKIGADGSSAVQNYPTCYEISEK